MKILVILLPILLQVVSGIDPDYSDPSAASNAFVTGNCAVYSSTAFTQSPILIETSNCAIYGSFSLTMADHTPGTDFATALVTTVTSYGAPYTDDNVYTDATLEFNGTTYKASRYLVRTLSEHVLFRTGRQADAEIQVLMDDGAGNNAVLSFLVKEIDSGSASSTVYTDSTNAGYISSDASVWSVKFASLAERITNHDDYEVFLNMFTYEGTQTFDTCAAARWFIYGSELYATTATLNAIRAVTKTVTGAANSGTDDATHNARPYTGTGGGAGSVKIYRMCYTGYFKVHLDVNYGLWFGMVSILIFFIFTLTYGDRPIKAYDYVESVWSIHPLISVFRYGNEIHTVKTRAALLLAMVTVHGLFSSGFFRATSNPTRSSNVIVYAIYSMLIDWPITLFVGNILRSYYIAKYQYYKTKEEAWDQKAQNRLFGFYVAVFIIVVVGWSFTVWNMGELHAELDEEASKLWVAAFFIGLGLELVLVYPIVCLLSKRSNFIRRIAKSVGFMYDNLCHESYLDFLKHD